MALKQAVTLPCGLSGEYHRITSITMDTANHLCTVRLSLYVDQASRQDGKLPIPGGDMNFVFNGVDYPLAAADLETSSPIKLLYAKLKASTMDSHRVDTSMFAQAIDC